MADPGPEIRVISEGELLNRDARAPAANLTFADQQTDPAGWFEPRSTEWASSLVHPAAALFSDPNGYRAPLCWVEAGPDDFRVSIELPGAALAEIDLAISDGTIVVTTDRETDEPGWHSGRFYGTLAVAEAADLENATAEFENGLLLIRLPRRKAAQPQHIAIASGGGSNQRGDNARRRKTPE